MSEDNKQPKKQEHTIKVMLEIGMPTHRMPPPPEKLKGPKVEKEPVEDKVRKALELIDSGHESNVEWILINKLYRDLQKLKKPNARARNLMSMIEPVLAKFGYHKVTSGSK